MIQKEKKVLRLKKMTITALGASKMEKIQGGETRYYCLIRNQGMGHDQAIEFMRMNQMEMDSGIGSCFDLFGYSWGCQQVSQLFECN